MLNKLRQRAGDEAGFTLIELLVVILIIGILAAIALPSFLSQRSKAQDTEAKTQARTAQTAFETLYTDEQKYDADVAKLKTVETALSEGKATLTATGEARATPSRALRSAGRSSRSPRTRPPPRSAVPAPTRARRAAPRTGSGSQLGLSLPRDMKRALRGPLRRCRGNAPPRHPGRPSVSLASIGLKDHGTSADDSDVDVRRLRAEAGFTVVEVLVAATVLLVGVAGALGLIDRANETTVTTRSREGATSLARELVESARAIHYDRLASTTLIGELAAQPGLADSVPGGPYTLVRRDVTYTVAGAVCTMDDPNDGGGNQTGGNFCTGSATPGIADRNPEDYKRATVTVSWTRAGVRRAVTQTTLINNLGAAGAPFVRAIAPSANPVTSPAVTAVTLQFFTSSAAATVNWMVDGSLRAPAPVADAARTTWTVQWQLAGALDGPYVIGAEAFDTTGTAGPTRQLTVQLNRFPPSAPTGVAAGRNRYGAVEVEWTANPERDIVGYEVRRGDVTVCSVASLGTATECRDPDPPPESAGDQTYTVRAYDRDPVSRVDRAGPGTNVSVIAGNLPPGVPVNLRRGTATTLQWSRPTPADPGPGGDTIAYYVVYRDGLTYGHRYARWYAEGSDITWSDPNPDGTSHTYWVAAVDTHRLESGLAGGVEVR